MKKLSDTIISLKSLKEYNDYASKKYENALILNLNNEEIVNSFVPEKGFYILSILIRHSDAIETDGVKVIEIENSIFKRDSKGFAIGPLHEKRDYVFRNAITSLKIDDGKIYMTLNKNIPFKSFELGLLIDSNYSINKGSTIVNFLSLINS